MSLTSVSRVINRKEINQKEQLELDSNANAAIRKANLLKKHRSPVKKRFLNSKNFAKIIGITPKSANKKALKN